MPHIRRPEVRDAIFEHGWETLLKDAALCAELKQRCGLCYQWVCGVRGIRKHIRDKHGDEFTPHEKDPLKQEAELWGSLLPSLPEGVAALQEAAKVLADSSQKDGKRRRTQDESSALTSQSGQGRGKGKGKGKGKAKKEAAKMNLDEAVQLMAAVTLQLVDQSSRIQLDTSFLLTIKNEGGPENLLPVMHKVWAQWKKIQAEEPEKLERPLRCSMLIALLMEMKARAEKLLQDAAQQERLKGLEWIDSFQSMRGLTPEMKGYSVAFEVAVGLRSEAEPLHRIFSEWTDLQVIRGIEITIVFFMLLHPWQAWALVQGSDAPWVSRWQAGAWLGDRFEVEDAGDNIIFMPIPGGSRM
ncbi:unnamed protein product [Symbiodinium necroappetens]|uniref:Uncharacterized protein n=1 Tax=Symbiodinium necroappetens TaxID=1628268 RepID=A0A813B9E2_9DINO|nr:unnamed protein product [Symbiodinium necroappetens]